LKKKKKKTFKRKNNNKYKMPPKKRQQKKAAKAKVVEEVVPEPSFDDDEEMSLTAKFAAMKAHHRSVVGSLSSRSDSRDIKIENITLTFHGKELLADATLELNYGNRYGLIGPNGSGKSTILETIMTRELPIPSQIDIYHLCGEVAPSERSALETVVIEVERELKRLEAEAEKVLNDEGPESTYLMELYERIDAKEPQTLTVRAAEILHGLGFTPKRMNAPTKDLSGGWRMRVALARALFVKPTLLLLDEPTNHLDIAACVWLEDYLKNYESTILLISHSQDFLNHVCTNTINLRKCKLFYYGGNYDTFIKTKSELDANQAKAFSKQQDDIEHIKKFIASCGTYSNLVRQAKSKQKIIDKMEAAGLVEKVVEEPKFNFRFPEVGYLSPPVLSFQKVSFSYSGKKEDELYSNLDFAVDLSSRIALVGPNGAGKSTLLKLMLGELQPTKGLISRHSHLKFGRYHQHAADALDLNASALDFVKTMFNHIKQDDELWRRELGRFGITGKMQVEPIGRMSDGLKSRLIFGLIAMQNPNILLLDEPTNHLDMECIDALAEAINCYDGGLVLVSHDLRLISQVAKDVWICDTHSVKPFKGDISDYKKLLQKQHQQAQRK
jgi:ATP-binding cassette subfamily F protein 2